MSTIYPSNPVTRAALEAHERIEPRKYVTGTVGFQDSWVDSGVNPVYYRKSVDGIVFVAGQCSRASIPAFPSTIFQLPRGYRPNRSHVWLVDSSQTPLAVSRIDIGGTGLVKLDETQVAPGSIGLFLQLCFPIDAEIT
jgi:hypothetical protein